MLTRQPSQEKTLVTPWWFENFISLTQFFFPTPRWTLLKPFSFCSWHTWGRGAANRMGIHERSERTHSALLSSSRTAFSWLSHTQNLPWEYFEGILLSVFAYPGSQESQQSQHLPASLIVHELYLGTSFNLHFVPQLVQKPRGLYPFRKALSFLTDGLDKVLVQPTA